MKVLLLDAETTPIISMVVTQSQLLAREVYLTDRVENRTRDKMKHLKCIVFVRPTPESIQSLVEELRDPCYGDYYLYFSNTLKKSAIERLAEADETEAVREVQEYYADFLAINNDVFSFNLHGPADPLFVENSATWDNRTFQRTTEGILSVLLALKKKPLVRYARTSTLAKKLAAEIAYQIQQEGPLFDFRKTDTPPILMILDRRNDPVTPLLNQWTYQAMVHELFGINNGRVDLSSIADVRPELREIVLSSDSDAFYKRNMFLNLGDLGASIKTYVDEYQAKHKSSMNIESISDMKKFMEDYPEFRKLSGNVTKHVTLVGELSRRVDKEGLLEAGELEQSLAVSENHNADLKSLNRLIQIPNISDEEKLRLVILYALRYEKSAQNQTAVLIDNLRGAGLSEKKVSLVEAMLEYAGADQRMDDLFANQDILARTKNVFKGLKGVENVYTQHTPHLVSTLQDYIKGRLKGDNYPFVESGSRDKPQDIIVFMIGGATYAEAREVQRLNAANPGVRIVLGGTTVHNSITFLREVGDSVSRWISKNNSSSPPLARLKSTRNNGTTSLPLPNKATNPKAPVSVQRVSDPFHMDSGRLSMSSLSASLPTDLNSSTASSSRRSSTLEGTHTTPRKSIGSSISESSIASSSPYEEKLTPSERKLLTQRSFFNKAVNDYMCKRPSKPSTPGTEDDDMEDDEMVVCIRARPLLDHEVIHGLYGTVTTDESGTTALVHALETKIDGKPIVRTKEFKVDYAFDENSQNEEVYAKTAKTLIPLALGGGVGSLFAYGQTGSGKTYTMTALEKLIARDLFDMARDYRRKTDGEDQVSENADFSFKVCFFELIGNQARDLLSSGMPGDVSIMEDVFGRVQVKGAIEEEVTNSQQLLAVIERGAFHRRTEGTAKNATSSRSHAVCRIKVTNLRLKEAEDGLLYLLDLAGSEGAADTRYHDKERIQESVEINKSLATLKDCIRNRALAESSGKHIHIPYRNSRLTVLLKEAFELASARLCKTIVIAALNPSILDVPQSLNTLRYIGPLKVAAPKIAKAPNPDDPAGWNNERLREWVIGAQGKLVKISPDVLCPTESGKQILRLPEAEFIDRCCQCPGVEPKAAKAFYLKLWKLLVDARTKTRNAKWKDLTTRMKKNSKEREDSVDQILAGQGKSTYVTKKGVKPFQNRHQ
ncbi:vacuolar protein sorting-associated protein 45 [Blyttiomyces sp. JEL0837]|nr:vacuolar protein sorting-associated protein 45 [Blyttiomyces sp. JEL0837]